MDWIVPVSATESSAGTLLPATANAVYTAMRNGGCVLLRGVFPVAGIDALYREFLSRYGSMDSRQMAEQSAKPLPNPFLEVGGGRYEITPRMTGAFGTQEFFARPLLRRFLMPLLGSDMRLSGFTVVVSHPGAPLLSTFIATCPPLLGAWRRPQFACLCRQRLSAAHRYRS